MSGRPVPEGFSSVTEGQATILQQGNSVFYNKAQVVNRDISLAVLRWFIQQREAAGAPTKRKNRPVKLSESSEVKRPEDGLLVLEAMAASGLRAIRYAKEVQGIGRVVANDSDRDAVAAQKRNIEFNDVGEKVTSSLADARVLMMQHAEVFDAVDVDPYGSPSELLDSTVQAVADGGLLLVTATDMAVLCGNNAETCFTKYGSYSLHKEYNHEQALRILLGCLAQHAARHKRVIEPILSLSIDFYIRIFVRVRTSPSEVKATASKLSYVWQSTGCDSWWLQPVGSKQAKENSVKYQVGKGPAVGEQCPISTGKFSMGGPIWNQPIHQPGAAKEIMQMIERNPSLYPANKKLVGLLRAVTEELTDAPLYYTLSGMSRTLKVTAPKMVVLASAIRNAGYSSSCTHCNQNGIKTDAPPEVVWDIMRSWARKQNVKPKDPESYQAKILAVEPQMQVDFSGAGGKKAKREPRFVQNPANWGPRPRHGRPMLPHEVAEAAQEGAAAAGAAQAETRAAPHQAEGAAKAEPSAAAPSDAAAASEADLATTDDAVPAGTVHSEDAGAAKGDPDPAQAEGSAAKKRKIDGDVADT